jgi:hypothetical protein
MRAAATAADTTPVSVEVAAAIEQAEAWAWTDCYAAARPEFAERAGLGSHREGEALVIRWAASNRRYFSRVIGFGVGEPAGEDAIDEILRFYERAGIEMFLLQSLPQCRPDSYEDWLRDRGLEPFDAQDRVFRDGRPFAPPPPGTRDLRAEPVGAGTADEWAEFLQRVYRLDTGDWLQLLVGRKGWHPYLVREAGEIAAARTMCITPGGLAWLGMDAPVPGLMSDDYEPDAALCAAIVEDGLRLGARGFLADIEAPSERMDTPAYEYFPALGFTRPYVRTHWARTE